MGRLIDWVVLACAWIAALLTLYIMFTISADVVGRYFFQHPIGWAIEFAEHALMAIPFLSMAWLVRQRGHVSIEIVVEALPKRLRGQLDAVISLLAAGTCSVAGWYAAKTAISQYERGVTTIGIYSFERYLLIALVAFGLMLAGIEFLRLALRLFAEQRR